MALGIGLETVDVAIANGASLSAAVPLGAKTLVGVGLPAAWTAAGLTFQVSVDGSTWLDLYSGTAEVAFTSAAAGRYVAVDPTLWRGVNFIKVRSGTGASAVNQLADRTLTLVLKPVA